MNTTSRTDAPPLRFGAVRVLKGRHAGKVGYYDDDESDHAVVYFGEPIYSGYVLIKPDHLVNVTSLEHERWKRAHPEFCRQMGIG
jgi:hypothetical protein